VGFCAIFGHFSTPEQNPAPKVLSTPAHPQVTQTVSLHFACNKSILQTLNQKEKEEE
jgi:hypothetical protein